MSTINDFGIPGVGTGILEPMRKNLWRVTFANFGGGTDSQPLSMQAVTFTKPKLTFEKITVHRYNAQSHLAAKHSFDPVTLVVESDVKGTAATVIQAQLQKQQWLIGAEGQWLAKSGEGSLYKFVCYLDQLDGNDQVIETWTLEGCWLESVENGDLDYSTGEQLKITLQISIDHARQSIGTYTQGPGIATGGAGKL